METIRLVYPVEGGDLIEAGEASSKMKLTLKKLGLPPGRDPPCVHLHV